jgi:regulator of nonsense transcripts 2
VQLSNDPSLSSLPLLLTFLKSYSRPYLGLTPPSQAKQQATEPPQTEGSQTETDGVQADVREEEELVETEMRDRFKRMCEGYFDSVCKKLVKEHRVGAIHEYQHCRLTDNDWPIETSGAGSS